MKKFEDLLRNEIKKAVSLANKHSGRTDCAITAWSSHKGDGSWVDVKCEICFEHGAGDRADFDVMVCVYLPDRRRSFVQIW